MVLKVSVFSVVFQIFEIALRTMVLADISFLLLNARLSKFVKLCQKQLPEVFYEKRCSEKFRKIHRKTLVPESSACNFINKETLTQVFFCEFCEIFESIFLTEHIQVTTSIMLNFSVMHCYSKLSF